MKKYIPHIIIYIIVIGSLFFAYSTYNKLSSMEKSMADINDKIKKIDINNIFMELTIHSILSNQLVDIANQYSLNQYTDCETIKNRLSGIKASFNLIDHSVNDSLFSNEIKGLKEANKKSTYLIKNWDYIEFCLSQPDAKTD